MKCPNCGLDIPEGHMYCDNCGTEINFVPDFEPEVENEIDATLLGLADELNKEERIRLEKKKKVIQRKKEFSRFVKERWRMMAVCGGGIAIALIVVIILTVYLNKASLYYLGVADKARSSGDMLQAIEYLEEGCRKNPGNSDIIFRLSDYYLEMGDPQSAITTLEKITDSAAFSEDKVLNAYESIISIYKSEGNYTAISELLSKENDGIVTSLREKYIPNAPSMQPESGSYDTLTVSLNMIDGSGNPIYYTVNDGDPDSSSILYESEIVISDEGEYIIKAVSVNAYGIASPVMTGTYEIIKGAPTAPEIMEPSGEYNQNTMIVAVAEAGTSIFYTTDGTDPTIESKQYVSPISMPVGTSTFKFVAIDNEGNSSEVVERNYHLVYTRLISTEQAVNMLVNTLVRLDILLDTGGKVRGVEGHYEYIYNSVIEIEGAGEYYVVVENHVFNNGTSAPTGLMYAVNTHDGTVNRLGYDSSGKYTLITISNR